jgi:hypothetical protein
VQSIESRFYPLQDRVLRAAVDATYEASLGFVTEAKWIRDYLNRMHGHAAELAMVEHHRSVVSDDFGDQVERRGSCGHSSHLLCSKSVGGAGTPAPPLF